MLHLIYIVERTIIKLRIILFDLENNVTPIEDRTHVTFKKLIQIK